MKRTDRTVILDILLNPDVHVVHGYFTGRNWPPDPEVLQYAIRRADFRKYCQDNWNISKKFHAIWDKAAELAGYRIEWVETGWYYNPYIIKKED